MNEIGFVVDVLTQWVITRRDFETLLADAIADVHVHGQEAERLVSSARQDFQRFQQADLDYFRRLRGNRERLASEIAGMLRW